MRSSSLLKAALLTLTVSTTSPQVASASERAPTCKTGTTAENRAVVMNFYKAYQTGDAALLRKALSSDFVSEPTAPGTKPGVEGAVAALERTHATFSDIQMTHDDIIASGNKVVVRSTIHAIQSGPLLGVPASNKPITFTAIDINSVCDGKMVSSHHEESWLTLLFQIGVLPPKR